ncbi:MAG: hypothetical protein HC886_02710 [Leptolyngbyaceae cyanobacterium SM1_1_3]|nr:hypothetical protein [Leptolyngbyaceae cyanobacterium SM1_1_3]
MVAASAPAVMTAAGGLTVTAGTYGLLSLWAAVDNPWLALGLLTPTALSLATLALLLLQFKASDSSQKLAQNSDLNQLLAQLTQSDPLRRLVAVQQILHWVEQASVQALYLSQLSISVRSQIIDCFRVLLVQESDPIVRNALRAGLQALSRTPPQLSEGAPLLQLEATAKVAQAPASEAAPKTALRSPVGRSQVEYVESLY